MYLTTISIKLSPQNKAAINALIAQKASFFNSVTLIITVMLRGNLLWSPMKKFPDILINDKIRYLSCQVLHSNNK